MVKDEKEKEKERLNDINRLFANKNTYADINSNNSISYEERIRNINSLFNIDTGNEYRMPNNNIKRDELQEFLKRQNDTIDYKNNEPTVENVVVENETFKSKGNNKKNKKMKINSLPTVNSSNTNFREQNKTNNLFKVNNANVKVASQKEQENMKVADDTDVYVLSKGEVDYRNNAERTTDTIKGVSGNVIEGIRDFIPSIVDYISSGTEHGTKKVIKSGLEWLGFSDKEVEKISETALQTYKNMSPISQLNYLLNNENKQLERNEKVNTNTLLASSSIVTKKLAELAPSLGDNVISMGLTAVNPVLGTASFILSAGGSYLDDARARGMNDDQAFGYATVMGFFEGATEAVISGSMVDKIGRKIFGRGLTDEVLNSFGVSAAENFLQEAIMEPLQETAATVFGGKEAANWEDMGQRFFESGIDGILSAIILGGASVGIASAENVVNKANPTSEEYNQAFVDTVNSGKVDVKGIIEGGQQAIITNENMQTFYSTTYNQDGSVANIQSVRGKAIENPNKKIKITPVVVKTQESTYNVIDKNTGLLLDSSPYQTFKEAQASFDSKIINLDDATINSINNKVTQANIAINQEISKTQSEMNADRSMRSGRENVINTYESPSNNVINNTQNGVNNVNTYINVDRNANSNTGTYTNIDTNTNNTYQTTQNQFRDDIDNNTQNYISNPNTAVNNQNNGLDDVTNLITRISDNAIYNKEETSNIFRFVAKSIPNIELQVNNNTTYINSLDRNGNVSYQQQIPNRIMSGGEIRDIVNNAINNADLSNINIGQINQNGFRGNSSNQMTKYTSRRSNKNVMQNNESAQQNSSKNKNTTVRTFVEQINNYKKKSVQYNKIIGEIVEININIFENISKRKQSSFLNEYLKNEVKGHDYYIGGQKIIANGTTIGKLKNGHTNFDKRIDTNIRNELKANIIGNLKQVISISEIYQANKQDTKNHTFADTFDRRKALVKYNDQNYEVMFEIGKKNNVNTLYGIENIKRTNKNRLSLPKLASKKGLQNTNKVVDGSHKSSKSITQNSKNVKSNTSNTNKSIQNNTSIAINSLNAIKAKYKNQTDQLNIFENKDNTISINNLVVKQNLRNKGIGQSILNDIMDYADKTNKTITLTPTSEYLTKNKLINWYKRNGFVENKGKNTDFSISDTMYKLPENNTQNIQKELHNRIQNAILSKNSRKNTFLGTVSDKVVNKIKSLFGIDVSGRKHIISDYDIRHMIKQHGNTEIEKTKGQIAITAKDIEKIPDIIENYDRIEKGSLNTNNITGKASNSIRYIKEYDNNTTYVVEIVPETGNTLQVKTMWKKHNKIKKNPIGLSHDNNNVPPYTSETKSNSGSSKSIPQAKHNVKDNGIRAERTSNAIEYDNQGNKLTKAQREFFKDSKIRDKDGKLLVMYHGSSENFTIFDNTYLTKNTHNAGFYGDGFYFTPLKEASRQYGKNLIEAYLKITNPFSFTKLYKYNDKYYYTDYIQIMNLTKINSEWNNIPIRFGSKQTWKDISNDVQSMIKEGKKAEEIDNIMYQKYGDISEEILNDRLYYYSKQNGYKTLSEALKKKGYDGIINAETPVNSSEIIVFSSNQIKNVTNTSPTSNTNIRYERTGNRTNKTLIAQHNTSEEKLSEALDLGALPVPSIAITKYQNPVLKYGDITLLFNRDTINPTDRRNVTYNSDIYSTRKPEIGIALDKQKLKSFEKMATEKGIGYGYLSMIEEYVEQNELSRARELIQNELEKNNDNVNAQDVENVYTELLESIQEKRIMKPGVDPYTPSGNRKSLIQRSIPYTLDNIVKIMTQKSTKGSESYSFAGLPEIRANLAQNFRSIESMHQNENNLVTSEEMENLKQEINDKFYALVDDIAKYDNINRYFGSTEVVANALNETAKAKNLSTAVLDNELDYVGIKNVPETILQKAIDFLNSMKNIPTEYFESKPQRAVGFNEVQKAIVPRNTSKELIEKLKSKGIPVEYYNTNEQRQRIISQSDNVRFEKSSNTSQPYDARKYEKNADFVNYLKDNSYLKDLMEVNNSQGETYAHSFNRRIEQEIRNIESTGAFDNSIPVTKLSDINKMVEDFLGTKISKGHFRQRVYGFYNIANDKIRVKEYKDMDNILHEMGHALDLGNRIKIDKEIIANELLDAVKKHGGYDNESRSAQLDEGLAEIIKEYAINPTQTKLDYPQTYVILEAERQQNTEFNKFMSNLQSQIYNYIHQSPQNRLLSNQSIGEQTDKAPITPNSIRENIVKWIWDKDYTIKDMTNELAKASGKKLDSSQNVYLLTRLASGVNNKAISMISNGYIDLNGNRLMPGLNKLGEILGNDPQRWNDLRAYLIAKRDLEYKAKSLKTGIRTIDSKVVVEQFYNDTQIQEAAQIVYDTLDGILQYAVDNRLINQETAASLRESNMFYIPFQRVIENRGNQIGRKGAVADIINRRTGSELDIKDVLENIVANSANIIQQVENNNILRTLAEQGEAAGVKNNIFEEISPPMKKIGTELLSTWETELKRQGVDTSKLDLEKTIDIFVPNNNIITEKDGSHIVSYFDNQGNRKYLQFYKESTDIFNALMGMDKNANSIFLKLMRSANMPLRYGATMANVGFAIPNMISDTAQATIYSEAVFVPVVDNILGVLDVLGATNKTVKNFLNKYAPEYAKKINRLYDIYQQTGASSSTRMSQYRKSQQEIMKDIYGVDSKSSLGIKDSFKPLKQLMNLLTYIPELSESSTRFRVFERNYEAAKNKGNSELDARIKAAIESRDATQDFGRTGTVMREINQLIPFSAARVGSAYTFVEKVKANPKRTTARIAILLTTAMIIKAIGYDDEEIEELNQRKKDDNFVFKIGNTMVTIKKPQGVLRSLINLTEYVQDLVTGHIEEGKEGERLGNWLNNAIMDNMPADEAGGLVPNAIAPIIENFINKDFYYNTDIVKSWDLDLPDAQQYYDYTSQLAIWLGHIFHYSPAKIDNLISGYLGGLGTQLTNVIDWRSGKRGFSAEKPAMGAEDNAVGKRFVVNVNENSASVDEIYSREEELTKKQNGGTITEEEEQELEEIKDGITKMSALNKQIKAIKQDLTMSGTEKADAIRPLQEQKTDVARQALGKEPIYTENTDNLEALEFYPSRSTLSYNDLTLNLTEDMKQEYMNSAYALFKQYKKQGLYSDEYLEKLRSKVKDAAKKQMIQKYKSQLTRGGD